MAEDGVSWTQNASEVCCRVRVAAGFGKEAVKVKFESTKLSVWLAGKPVVCTELAGKVDPDDCFWAIEGEGDSRQLVLTLAKKKSGQWKACTKAEEATLETPSVLDEGFDVMELEHDDDSPERVEEQEENERKLEARYKKLVQEKGIDNEDTLQTFFALFDNCIQLYRLNKLADYLQSVLPVCRKRNDKYKLKAIQALAFVRWKQGKFREALPLFHEMEEILGKGAALCENIAHTYSSLGDYEKAEDYFRQSLRFIEQENGPNRGNRGGVLLGLGLVRDRLGKHKQALEVVQQAYNFYKERASGAPASLQAKAGISCAKINAKLGNLPKAEAYIREAIQMYEVTCGETSPLTASAYHELGKCLWAQRKREPAQQALKRCYELETMKDAWDLVTILEIHNLLMDTHCKETDHIDRDKFAPYFGILDFVVNRVKKELPQDGNAAVYYKAAAEMKAWGGEYAKAKELFEIAIPLLEAEKSTDCSGLIQSCKDMVAFCERNLAGLQASPMSFDIPQAENKHVETIDVGAPDTNTDVIFEELETIMHSTSSASASKAVAAPEILFKTAGADDFAAVVLLCTRTGVALVLDTAEAFASHLEVGSGKGLCWKAECGDECVGFILVSNDGLFGHALQVLADDGKDVDEIKRGLVDRATESCRQRGLRSMNCPDSLRGIVPCASPPSASSSSAALAKAAPERKAPNDSEGAAPAAASAEPKAPTDSESAAPKPKAKLDTKELYESWDKVNVEQALLEEDGIDPCILPPSRSTPEDFGDDVGILDVSTKIKKYSWDQSSRYISIYIPMEGIQDLPPETIDVRFKKRGVLLTVDAGGKRHWFKVPNLCGDVDVENSSKKIKTDQAVIKIRKSSLVSWSDLTDEKDLYQQKRQYRIHHGDLKGATTEDLLADMYQNANDEDRNGLREAMRVNREKREEEARAKAGKK